MKLTKKIIAVFLTTLTLFSICSVAMPVFAEYEWETGYDIVDDMEIVSEEAEPEIISEITEKRQENTKYFLMSDGSFMAAQYSGPVHYVDSEGEWADYDNSLSETEATQEQADLFGESELYMTGNEADNVVFAPKSNSNTLVSYEAKDYPISLNYQSAKKSYIKVNDDELELKGNDAYLTLPDVSQEVLYEDVFGDVDLQYIVNPGEIKENIILKSKEAENTFTVNYNIGVLTADVVASHTINLMSGEEVIYTISAPYMYDAAGAMSEAVTLTVNKNKNGKFRVTIVANSEWLQSVDRVYPVVLDPTITTETTKDAIDSVFVANNSSYINRNFVDRMEMLVGRETSNYGYCRSLFKFDLPALNKGDMVVAASLNVAYYDYDVYASTTPDLQVNAHLLQGSWDKTTVTWNNCPSYSSTILDYQMFTRDVGWKTFDISSAVKQWYEGESTNYGILLKGASETGTMAENGFKAAIWTERYNTQTDYYPRISITYRSNKGLEDYWSYTTLSAGTAGTAYINDYTGNLVFIHGDVATTGELMPVSLEHVYNGYMADTNAKTYPHSGRGNKLSLQQTVKASSYYGLSGDALDMFPYAYEDGDGTVHYFYKETKDGVTKYIDEDGLNLTLKVTSSGYTITDKSDNVMTFDTGGYLKTIADADGRTATLTYKDGKNTAGTTYPFLDKITDGAGHTITLDYNTGNGVATGNNQLKSIIGPDGKKIEYTVSSGCVTKITYPDNTFSTYTYDSDRAMTSACSSDGYKLEFTYTTDGSKRVASVIEKVDDDQGQKIVFSRKKLNQTIIRTSGDDGVYGNSDDIRNIYQFDNFGRTVSTKMRLASGTNMGAENYNYTAGSTADSTDLGKRNRVSASAAAGRNITNLLTNHSVESSGSWTSSYWESSSYSTGTNTAAISSEDSYLGTKSIKVNVPTAATANGGYCMYQDVTLTTGATYTLSGYIKTNNVTVRDGATTGGATLAMSFVTADGKERVYSNKIDGTTESSIDSGWQRITLTFEVPSNVTSSRVALVLYNASGTAYFDCLQLEKNNAANSYNVLENAGFEKGTANWTAVNTATSDTVVTSVKNAGTQSYMIAGDASADKYIRQSVYITASEKDTFIVSGYAKANAIPLDYDQGKRFDLSIRIDYTDGTYKYKQKVAEFNDDVADWQYVSGVFTLSDDDSTTNKTANRITIYCGYRKQANTCYFDDMSLIKEPAPTYSYDDDGNLISATENAEKTSALSYDSNDNLSSFTDEKNSQYTYTYDTGNNKHRLLSAVSSTTGVTYAYTYYTDTGLLRRQDVKDADGRVIRTGYVYTEADSESGIAAGAYVWKDSDQHGYHTVYDYDYETGRVKSVTDPENNVTEYTYDEYNGLVKSVTSGEKTVNYTYNSFGTRLLGIEHNGFDYNFVYDGFGNVTQTKVEDQLLMENTYQDGNGKLIESNYGNDSKVEYTYNAYGQTRSVTKDDVLSYYWRYNSTGMPSDYSDYVNNRIYRYEYDSLGRIVRQYGNTRTTGANRFISQYTYDVSNNVTRAVSVADGDKVATNYTYDAANRPTKTTLNSDVNFTYSYDSLGRLGGYTLNLAGTAEVPVTYTYYTSNRGSNFHTTQIETENIGGRVYTYAYDKNGNIKEIKIDGVLKHSYVYDELGQLERENNVDTNETIKYTYDNGGNIDKKEYYTYTTGSLSTPTKTVDYSYDSTWRDKLTSYNGQNIFYDSIGNPVTYRDGMSFTWQGRQMTAATLSDETEITYTYDADGLRTTKQVGSTLYEYEYVGGQLVYEKRGDIRFYYRYDALGQLASIKRINAAGTTYTVYAVTNSRGDVEELRHLNGSLIARYKYDAWGNTLSIVDADGNEITSSTALPVQNPFRYRGYYYDSESGLYYLQSRYYDPVTCRFVSADSQISGVGGEILGYNLYAYCQNDPINMGDESGQWPLSNLAKVFIGAVATAAAVAITVVTGGAALPVIAGVVASTVVSGAIGYATGGKKGMIDGLCDGFMWGGIGALASSVTNAVKAVKTAKKGVAIGEKMTARVEPFAKENNLATYEGLKGYKAIEKLVGKNTASKLGMAHNKAWINRQVKLGAKVFDVGPAGSQVASPFYAMERSVVNGYHNYIKCF